VICTVRRKERQMSHFPWNRPEPQKQPHDTAARHWRPGIVALAAAMALSACNDKDSPIKAEGSAPAATPGTAQLQPAAYVPPSADVLYQMVAPIALYPDKLVAQILAGATYPDQIGAAETWLVQNPGLQKAALANAVNAQNWDPSVKSLTQFPNVLEQMASNLPWTTALGKAYYNDPADVMNAIQVMRNRAYKAGTLKTSRQLKVHVASMPSAVTYTPGAMLTPLPDPVIEPPEQFIEIAPYQVDTVYVPQYDPGVVYGPPLPVYGGYHYVEVPPPVPVAGVPVVAGLLGFGIGIVLAESVDRYPSWGWNSWNMHWGAPDRPWRHGDSPAPALARPAVVYNNTTYVSQSRTVVQNIHRTDNTYVNNVYENRGGPAPAPMQTQAAGAFAPQHGLQPGAIAAGAAGAAVGAAALAAGNHAWSQRQQQRRQTPLAAVPQGRPDSGQRQPPAAPAMPHAPNGNAFMQPHDQRGQEHSARPGRQPQAPPMQAAMAEKTEQQQQQQQRAREQARRQQQMQQQVQAREQQQRQQQARIQQMQQQRAQEQAMRQQQMQLQAQAREQQQRQQQARMQQAQQQRAQEQAQRQQQMQQQAQAREQQQRQQQARMQQAQQQRAQEQAVRQQQMQQRAQEQAQRQAAQQAHMQAVRAEARAHGDHDRR
jgi:DNA segregation ATPase FtsK/SpoIIIE-like protein